MDTPIDTVKEAKRHTHTYSFFREPLNALEGLSSLMTAFCLKSFTDDYGNILTLLETVVDTPALQTLMQFYDPEMRCFTFQDYQLAPTLEEYSIILNLKVKDEVPFIDIPKEVNFKLIAAALYLSIKEVSDNWKSNGGVSGFSLKFLVRKAKEEFEKKNWNAYNSLLAVAIYGIVMFPNVPNFVDSAAVHIFMGKNPIPTLLADTYYAVHSRYEKRGGAITCCLQLLFIWFLSLLPNKGPFVKTRDTLKWTHRIMSLTSYDIQWQKYRINVSEVIVGCGKFDNVPLVGTRGCINYNPVVSLRQLGYTLKDKPADHLIAETVYFEKGSDPEKLKGIIVAWKKIRKHNGAHLGKKESLALTPYVEWIVKRVGNLLLPYDRVAPLQKQPPLILSEFVPTELYKDALVTNYRLHEREQETNLKFFEERDAKMRLMHQLKQFEGASSSQASTRRRPYELLEEDLYQKQQECLLLQRSESSLKRQKRDSDKQLAEEKAKSARLEEELRRLRAQRRGDGEVHSVIRRS
ncbi:uncharacterized protein LOC131619228 [Vicia villosa]|uniref:uncharacterized protein LOC131619228 n=1 Tax=Vicia villosa TaxID=3911 RepID=UPI00273C5532|nr:uncharacterized protein LOC131619228 [Vicia villosa]